MNLTEIKRLREEQDKAVECTKSKILQWQKFKDDYLSLQKRLLTLPDKVTHDVMVPFGDLAFMPGQLVHTNEINVLLGDNWFVERSAKQAAEIVSRRIKSINGNLEELEEEMNLLKPRQQFTEELENMATGTSDMKEITELLDVEQEKKWRAQHKENVRKYREQLNSDIKQAGVGDEDSGITSDKALWDRLDQLEKEEEERGELEQSSGEDDVSQASHHKTQRRVSWVDHVGPSSVDHVGPISQVTEGSTSESDYDTDTEDDVARQRISCIHFSHTTVSKTPSDSIPNTDTCSIKSPADIYEHFGKSALPKSILKKKKTKFKTTDELTDGDDLTPTFNVPHREQQNAFSGEVVEKLLPSATTSTVNTSRPVSKFKSRRIQMTHPDQ